GIRPDSRVAGHARFGGGEAGEVGVLDGCVAVAAVDPKAADVVIVTEGNRLVAREADVGHPGGALHLVGDPDNSRDDEERAENARLGEGIESRMKNAGHARGCREAAGKTSGSWGICGLLLCPNLSGGEYPYVCAPDNGGNPVFITIYEIGGCWAEPADFEQTYVTREWQHRRRIQI